MYARRKRSEISTRGVCSYSGGVGRPRLVRSYLLLVDPKHDFPLVRHCSRPTPPNPRYPVLFPPSQSGRAGDSCPPVRSGVHLIRWKNSLFERGRTEEEEERRGIRHCKEGEKSLFISKATGAAEEEEEGEKRDKNAHGSLFLFPVSRFLALGFDARLWWRKEKKDTV